jgi:hypothetical protein
MAVIFVPDLFVSMRSARQHLDHSPGPSEDTGSFSDLVRHTICDAKIEAIWLCLVA